MTDADVLAVIDKMVKQRRDSISQFEAGKRMDLVAVEQAELEVLQGYLPQQLADAEIDALVAAAIAATGAAGPAGMGKVMAELKPQARRPRRHDRGLGQGEGEARRWLIQRRDRASARVRGRAHWRDNCCPSAGAVRCL